jgi:ribonuclease HII
MGHTPDMPVADVRALLAATPTPSLPRFVSRFRGDLRPGVVGAVESARKRLRAYRAELRRLEALGALQREMHESGCTAVAGLDEVGRGALAGPVTAAAVVLACEKLPEGVDDSKRLTPEQRVRLDVRIREAARAVAVIHISPCDIDRLGIARAVHSAMRLAVADLPRADHALVDGRDEPDLGVPATAVIKGDSLVGCIAAASIVAKVARDALMVGLDEEHPGYGFAVNKGYGTPDHLAALLALGPSPVHRRSFAPCTQPPLF